MSKIIHHEEGCCPICGSTDITYGDIYWNTDRIDPMLEQECTCGNCQCEYKEQYNAKHCGKDIIWEDVNREKEEWIECDYCHEEFIKDDVRKDDEGKWICCGCNKEYEKIEDFNF